jgi:hypothetical protein
METESSLPKHCVLKCKHGNVLDKDRRMDNVQKHNICIADRAVEILD